MKNGGLTAELVDAKLREYNGNMAAVGRHFGVTRQAVWDFVNKREKLKAVTIDVREAMKDNAESALYSAVLNGEAWAVCFFLKTQAKDRGYVEQQQLVGKDGERLAVDLRVEVIDGPAGQGSTPPGAGSVPSE